MFRILMLLGLALFLPGGFALGYSLWEGPASWTLDDQTFWGTPISLFVFWIGLAHAGTLLSAVFLSLKIKLDRRTALLAELSTLASLAIAAIFPLMHLGVIKNFYMVAPFLDARGNIANVQSPLVWDFCCIAVYGFLSLLFFATHLKAKSNPALECYHKPMAWLLFPLVLWVHTVVSLDFANTFVPEWQGAFFPVYFIVGAIFSGIALVNLLLLAEGYRSRRLERLQLVCSWILMTIWVWDFFIKGTFSTGAFIFAGVLPQLYAINAIRECKMGRAALSICILTGLFLERYFLVAPQAGFGKVDLGLLAFSVGGFILLFFGCRRGLSRFLEGDNSFFGEVDGCDMAATEEPEWGSLKGKSYIQPWASDEFKMLRLPLLLGVLAALVFSLGVVSQSPFKNVELSFVNIIPLTFPIVAFAAALAIYGKAVFVKRAFTFSKKTKMFGYILLLFLGGVGGTFYAGGVSTESIQKIQSQENLNPSLIIQGSSSPSQGDSSLTIKKSALLWEAHCASCHGANGSFNEKFVREFYPVPQKLTVPRLDSLGNDSLVKVILKGRVNMNAYEGRLTRTQAQGLVAYMRLLANSTKEDRP